jgi:sensor c-di-GMP phosphodiesterase-like protein
LIASYEIYAQGKKSLFHHMHAMTLAALRYPAVIVPSSFIQFTRCTQRVPCHSQVRGREQGNGLYSEAKRARVALSELRRDPRYEPLSFESLLRTLRRPVVDISGFSRL